MALFVLAAFCSCPIVDGGFQLAHTRTSFCAVRIHSYTALTRDVLRVAVCDGMVVLRTCKRHLPPRRTLYLLAHLSSKGQIPWLRHHE